MQAGQQGNLDSTLLLVPLSHWSAVLILCLSILAPVLIKEKRVVMMGTVKALKLLSGRQSCCGRKEKARETSFYSKLLG